MVFPSGAERWFYSAVVLLLSSLPPVRSFASIGIPNARALTHRSFRGTSIAIRCPALRASSEELDFSAFEAEVQKRGAERQTEVNHRHDGSPVMDALELRQLVVQKWGRPFDTKIHRRRDAFGVIKYYLQVMWKHVEQQSFHLTEAEYMEQLEAVASLISEWGLADFVRQEIRSTKQKPGIQVGGGPISGAVAVSIPLATEDENGAIVPTASQDDARP